MIPLHGASAEVLDQELTCVTPPISPCADREPADALHVLIEIADNYIHREQPGRRLDRRRCFRLDEPEELPKRSPHLNPMDHLWRHGKGVISANWQYDTIEALVQAFVTYLAGLSPRQALRKAGILSEDFWLKQ